MQKMDGLWICYSLLSRKAHQLTIHFYSEVIYFIKKGGSNAQRPEIVVPEDVDVNSAYVSGTVIVWINPSVILIQQSSSDSSLSGPLGSGTREETNNGDSEEDCERNAKGTTEESHGLRYGTGQHK